MTSLIYRGPAQTLVVDGTLVRQGDTVALSDEQLRIMMKNHHRFQHPGGDIVRAREVGLNPDIAPAGFDPADEDPEQAKRIADAQQAAHDAGEWDETPELVAAAEAAEAKPAKGGNKK